MFTLYENHSLLSQCFLTNLFKKHTAVLFQRVARSLKRLHEAVTSPPQIYFSQFSWGVVYDNNRSSSNQKKCNFYDSLRMKLHPSCYERPRFSNFFLVTLKSIMECTSSVATFTFTFSHFYLYAQANILEPCNHHIIICGSHFCSKIYFFTVFNYW